MATWTVKLCEVFEDQRPNETPVALPSFGVQGTNSDQAKTAARAWLVQAGKKLRSIATCEPASAHCLTAVVMVKRGA